MVEVALTLLLASRAATGAQCVDRMRPVTGRWRPWRRAARSGRGGHHAVRRPVRQALRRPTTRAACRSSGPSRAASWTGSGAPGERALDIGAGRGAATFPLAEAVGAHGPGRRARPRARHGPAASPRTPPTCPHVHVTPATPPTRGPPRRRTTLIASSLVIFFLDDPVGALGRWRALLRAGGRLGVATFQPWCGAWQALSDLYDEFAEDPIARRRPLARTDAGVEAMLIGAGFSGRAHRARDVRDPVRRRRRVASAGPGRPRWAACGGGRRRPPTPRSCGAPPRSSSAGRDADGRIVLEVGARYTFGIS